MIESNPRMYRGVLLDFYGTIVHEDDDIIPVICDTIRQHATVPCTSSEIGQLWWRSFSTLFTSAHGADFLSQRDEARRSLADTLTQVGAELNPDTLLQIQFEHWVAPPLFPDALPFLRYLSGEGVPVCIVSNIDRADLELAIAFHDLQFDHVITSDDVKSYKPRPEIFEAALTTLGLQRDEVLHVGDSRTSDVAGAQALGIPVAWVNRTGKPATGGTPPTHEVRDLAGLQILLTAWSA